jgi:DNA-binding MarR family transcriptional regulator
VRDLATVGGTSTNRSPNLLGACALLVSTDVTAASEAFVGQSGGVSAASAMTTLLTFDAMTIDELAKSLGLSHSGASRLVDRLEERQWCLRSGQPTGLNDRRSVRVRLTQLGEEAARELLSTRQEILTTLLSPLTSAEQAVLDNLLSKIISARTIDVASLHRTCRMCDHSICQPCPALTALDR